MSSQPASATDLGKFWWIKMVLKEHDYKIQSTRVPIKSQIFMQTCDQRGCSQCQEQVASFPLSLGSLLSPTCGWLFSICSFTHCLSIWRSQMITSYSLTLFSIFSKFNSLSWIATWIKSTHQVDMFNLNQKLRVYVPPLPPPQSHWAPLANFQAQSASPLWSLPDYPVLKCKTQKHIKHLVTFTQC